MAKTNEGSIVVVRHKGFSEGGRPKVDEGRLIVGCDIQPERSLVLLIFDGDRRSLIIEFPPDMADALADRLTRLAAFLGNPTGPCGSTRMQDNLGLAVVLRRNGFVKGRHAVPELGGLDVGFDTAPKRPRVLLSFQNRERSLVFEVPPDMADAQAILLTDLAASLRNRTRRHGSVHEQSELGLG